MELALASNGPDTWLKGWKCRRYSTGTRVSARTSAAVAVALSRSAAASKMLCCISGIILWYRPVHGRRGIVDMLSTCLQMAEKETTKIWVRCVWIRVYQCSRSGSQMQWLDRARKRFLVPVLSFLSGPMVSLATNYTVCRCRLNCVVYSVGHGYSGLVRLLGLRHPQT